jgi:hypothetical protein
MPPGDQTPDPAGKGTTPRSQAEVAANIAQHAFHPVPALVEIPEHFGGCVKIDLLSV